MRWNNSYLILVLEDQYVGNYNNNATDIFIVAMHVVMVYIHTLLPWPCQLMLHIYDAHMVSQSLYMSQIGDQTFHRTFYFVHFDLKF